MDHKELLNYLKNKLYGSSLKFVILTHKNPDADAMGSSLGLAMYLQKFGHRVNVICPTDFPDFLRWLPSVDQVMVFSQEIANEVSNKINQAAAVFLVDFNKRSRIEPLDVFLNASPACKILIDHHLAPETFDLMFSDPSAPAASVLVFRLIEQMGHLNYINRDIAICLYTALVSDTGSFRFPSVTSEAHLMAAHFIEKGINVAEVQDRLYAVFTPERMQLLTKTLKRMKVLPPYNTAYMYLSSEDMQDYDPQKGDTEGFVNYGLNLKNILLSVFFIEDGFKKIIKISFRSKGNFDVNAFARKHFKGGGHLNAAGGISKKSLKETLEYFLSLLPLYQRALSYDEKS